MICLIAQKLWASAAVDCSDGTRHASMGPHHEAWRREHRSPIRIQWMLLSSLGSPLGKGNVGVQVSKDMGGLVKEV